MVNRGLGGRVRKAGELVEMKSVTEFGVVVAETMARFEAVNRANAI